MRDHDGGKEKSRSEKRESNKPTSEDFKNRIRKQFDFAVSSSASASDHSNKHENEEYLTPSQKQQRMRQLEMIGEGNFRQQSFSSSLGKRQQKSKEQVSRSERISNLDEERDRMLFGPATKPLLNSLPEQIGESKHGLTCLPKEASFLIHPSVLIDGAIKERTWKNLWLEQRRNLGY
ncbi:unnamed protein product [Auanema sp. JU1783]|nr:unnamed protein product [Auanema sp. JU1783]